MLQSIELDLTKLRDESLEVEGQASKVTLKITESHIPPSIYLSEGVFYLSLVVHVNDQAKEIKLSLTPTAAAFLNAQGAKAMAAYLCHDRRDA